MEQLKNVKSKQSTTVQKKIAAAYLRVSTKKQNEEGVSLEFQRKYAKEFANANNMILEDAYIFEEAKPASKIYTNKYNSNTELDYDEDINIANRPILNKILTLAQQRKINTLIVYTRDRLSRNVEEYFSIKYMLSKYKVSILYSKPGENINTSANDTEKNGIEKLIDIILASIGELETNLISSRTRLGNEYCVQEKLWPGGKIPFGYRAEPVKLIDGKKKKTNSALRCIPYEKEIIKEVFEYYTNYGFGYRKLSQIMREKYPFKNWTKSSIESILNNQIYTGHIVWGRRGGRRHPDAVTTPIQSPKIEEATIINDSLWNRTLALRHEKYKAKNDTLDPKYFSTPFLLRGKLICNKCGQLMTCKNYGKNKKSVYRCPSTNENNISELILEKNLVESIFISKLTNMICVENTDHLWDQYSIEISQRKETIEQELSNYQEQINALEAQLLEIENTINNNIPYAIKLELMQLITRTEKEVDAYTTTLQFKENQLDKFFITKEGFKNSLDSFFLSFDKLSVNNKRMIINYLVDNIKVDTTKSPLNMEIVINPPKEILSPSIC
ncbi:recombinase family protein [Lutibacter sp. B2]|nr:recombinase family protein [Lutibacter sp. B2]